MEFGLLGPIVIWREAGELALGSAQRRCVLAMLLLQPGQVVPMQRLRDALWPGRHVPGTARNVIQGCVSQLRNTLAADPEVRLCHRSPGYLLEVEPQRVDLYRFRDLVTAAKDTADDHARAELLGRALTHWRGEPLADVEDSTITAAVRSALTDERLDAEEHWVEARLRLGHHRELTGELTVLVAAHPLRERLRGLHMLALFQSGRHAEALRAFADTRSVLVDELGIEPGPELQRLQQRILAADRTLLTSPQPREPLAPVPRQLPAAPGLLAGRDEELAALRAAVGDLRGTGVVTVEGAAGTGKTALSVYFGHECAGAFPDGQLHLDLHGHTGAVPLPAGEALARLLRGLGRPPAPGATSEQELGAAYRSALVGKRMLILLDDARDADQVLPLLPGAPGCLVLVTGRAGLAAVDAGLRLRPAPLAEPAALAVLAHWAGPDRVAAEPAAAAAIAAACTGLPLALRIAGARLAARPGLPISALTSRLTDPQRRLDELRAGSHSVRAAFSASLRVLDAGDEADRLAARAFRHAGDGELPGMSAADTHAAAERLVDHHLLEPAGPGRYRMPELLRLYAAELGGTAPPTDLPEEPR
jgi:DNA-binding SARP family transcriptional activator